VLVFRNSLDVDTLKLSAGVGQFVHALQNGQTLLDATNAASSGDSEFDLPQALALLLRLQLITHITSGDRYHEHAH